MRRAVLAPDGSKGNGRRGAGRAGPIIFLMTPREVASPQRKPERSRPAEGTRTPGFGRSWHDRTDPQRSGKSMTLSNKQAWKLVTDTFKSWHRDRAQSMGAALAFYTLFSIAPLLLIVISVDGYFLGARTMRGEIDTILAGVVGDGGARAIERLARSANEASKRSVAAWLGVTVFLVGATSVFNELQDILNRIWKTPGRRHQSGILTLVRNRLLSIAMIFGISVLLMVSLALSTTLAVLAKSWGTPSAWEDFTVRVLGSILSYSLVTTTFALIYRLVPRANVRLHDVWIGAALTAALYTIGNRLIGVYLRHSTLASSWGTLGSAALFLLWVYYSAQIFLLGAEFTWVFSRASLRRKAVPAPLGLVTPEPGPRKKATS
jgi:membrane protein